MARIIDDSKLASVKKTLVDIIVLDGSSNASIAKMAQKAQVSSGYLYRHYDSKESLLKDLYVEKFAHINQILLDEIQQNENLQGVITGFYTQIVKIARSNENEILFLLKMMTDYSMKISDQMRMDLGKTVAIFRNKFQKEINVSINAEQIFIQMLGTILLFINMRKRGVFRQTDIDNYDINAMSEITLKALK